ncbi:MAG: efflux RND transporter permease subunit, partial [Acidobacteriota bacterium]
AIVRLQDIARIRNGHKERDLIGRINGQETVEVAVYKEGGTNTVSVSDTVKASLENLRSRLRQMDPGLKLSLITDQAGYIRQSVSEVLHTAVYGGSLAILILFFFLRSWKSTAIIGIAIPVSVVATFFLMYVAGISLNIMSLGGLTLGIGLLVDNSIVVLEAIQRHRDAGCGEEQAARIGTSEVARAVMASTLTTICVFVPIVFVEGVAGQMFGDQALTVTFSLLVSRVVALTLIPMLAARRMAAPAVETEPAGDAPRWGIVGRTLFRITVQAVRAVRLIGSGLEGLVRFLLRAPLVLFEAAQRWLAAAYLSLLNRVLARPLMTLAVAVAVFASSLLIWPHLGRELVPQLVQGEFFVDLELPPGTQLDLTQKKTAAVERFGGGLRGVRNVYSLVGSSNLQGGVSGEKRENIGQITVMVTPPVSREREEDLMARLRAFLDGDPQFRYRFGRPSYFSFRTPIEVEIRGYNLTVLRRLADQLVSRMKEIPGLRDVKSSTEGGHPELQIRFDRQRLAVLGLSLSQAAEAVRAKVQGVVATDIQRQDRKIDIRMRAEEQFRDSVPDLEALTVFQKDRTAIPLSSVATVVETEGPAEIRRAEGDRVASISANLEGRDLEAVSTDIKAILNSMPFPSGFDWRIGGQRQEMETSFRSMRLAILLAVFMVYLVMASQFESLLHPLVILFSMPLAVVGVLGVLALFNIHVSIVVLIGGILLAGIVVNNAIILVDYTNQLRREGRPRREALIQAGQVRLRPILMTTSTTVLGLLPMAMGLGAGSELRSPMALTVIGGLLTSTALTLLVIPALYHVLDRRA